MILHSTAIAGREGSWHIQIKNGKIAKLTSEENELEPGERIELENAICLPGFINSHDHLDFNQFPQLRDKIYTHYAEWGPSIQKNHQDLVARVLKIPAPLRIKWGLYKNLLNGFTTVVNHGKKLAVEEELVDVFQNYYPLHSPGFEKNWQWKLNNPFKTGKPFVMHLGEGTDAAAKAEIDKVIRSNYFKKDIIAIHGVAMKPEQAGSFRGLVWCPASNYFLLDQTADIKNLDEKTRICFGTDSTLTAPWNVWEHFHLAHKNKLVSEQQLLSMLGPAPAALWKFEDRGQIEQGLNADILVLKRNKDVFQSGPEDILLVIKNGLIKLIDQELLGQVKNPMKDFSRIRINNSTKIVTGGLAGLTRNILTHFPEAQIPFELVTD